MILSVAMGSRVPAFGRERGAKLGAEPLPERMPNGAEERRIALIMDFLTCRPLYSGQGRFGRDCGCAGVGGPPGCEVPTMN